MELEKIKDIIDECSLGLYKSNNWEFGGGRDILLLDNVVVKFPNNNLKFNGGGQNITELEVYNKTKHEALVPVYGSHLGAIICKKVSDIPVEIYMKKYSINEMEATFKLREDIKNKIHQLNNIIKEFRLSISDLEKLNSWGYDKDIDDIVCLDYGLVSPNKKAYMKLLDKKSYNEIMELYDISVNMLDSMFKYIPKINPNQRQENDRIMENIFGLYVPAYKGIKIIMDVLVSRKLAEYKIIDIESANNIIKQEIVNECKFNNKINKHLYNNSIYLSCIGFEVNIYRYDYNQAVDYLTKLFVNYRSVRAFICK